MKVRRTIRETRAPFFAMEKTKGEILQSDSLVTLLQYIAADLAVNTWALWSIQYDPRKSA